MKRLHVHITVNDLDANIRFYSSIFGAQPDVKKDDYAKWQLEDPRVNFAVSARGAKAGVEHLGIQVESADELAEVQSRLAQADAPVTEQIGGACCYARSDKYWITDPQGVAWEAFHTLDSVPTFSGDAADSASGSACRTPRAQESTRQEKEDVMEKASSCCTPAREELPAKSSCC